MNSLEPSDVLALFRATSRKLFLPKFTFSALIVSNCTSSFRDRKSTRLNSSHSQISYAVFCLKKKIHKIHLVRLLASLPCLLHLGHMDQNRSVIFADQGRRGLQGLF